MKKINGMLFGAALLLALPTVVAAQDTTAPTVDVFPDHGATVYVGPGDSFVWVVDADDESALARLEIDHSMWTTIPEPTVLASEADPYDGQEALYASFGTTVTYDAKYQEWVINFGPYFTDLIFANGGITFYIVVDDEWVFDPDPLDTDDIFDNRFGSMYYTTPENTFAYTFEYGPYNKDSCKKDGWQNFLMPPYEFRNQGQCVKHVNRRDR